MKFYYNDKLVRTSKNHNYTHAVMCGESVIGCRTSIEACQSVIRSEISRCEQSIQSCDKKIKAINEGKKGYWSTYGRGKKYWYQFEETDTIENISRRKENYKKEIEFIKNNWKIVELECR